MPTKVTIELIMDDKAYYESGPNESIITYIESFQKLAKTFSYDYHLFSSGLHNIY